MILESIYLSDVPSPFGLAAPAAWWTEVLAAYDPDLRIFPSQTKPLYRVMRVARLTGGLNFDRFKHVLTVFNADTKIALERRLVPVMTFGPDVFNRHPSLILDVLKRRDTWALGTDGVGGDKAADLLDAQEAEEEKTRAAAWRDEGRARRRAMKIAYRYRTGGRVSLVRPRRHSAGSASPETPGGAAAVVTPQE
jgi:hypothetical protein